MRFLAKKKALNLMLAVCTFMCLITSSIEARAAGYDINAAVQFAYNNYENSSCGLCAEFVSRCVQAGGLDIGIHPGVGNLYRALLGSGKFEEYEMAKSGQQIKAIGANAGKIAVGDVLIHYKTGDPRPYEHAMFVTTIKSNGVVAITQRNANRKNMEYPAYDGCKVLCLHYKGDPAPPPQPKPVPQVTDVKVSEAIDTNPESADYGRQYGYTVSCKVENASDLTKVEFPTWTDNNGQDDLIWHQGTRTSDGRYTYTVNKSEHNNETGVYYTHVYAWNSEGKNSVAQTSMKILSAEESDAIKPEITDVKVENKNEDGFTISCKVEDTYGVSSVIGTFKYDNGTKEANVTPTKEHGRYWFRVKVADHDNCRGEYKFVQIAAKNKVWNHKTIYDPSITIDVPYPTVNVAGVTLDKTTLALEVGQTSALVATVSPDDATNKSLVWTSSNETVAKVEDGTVTAVSAGTATIKATSEENEELFAECTVTVTTPAPAPQPGTGESGNGNTGNGSNGKGSSTGNTQTQNPTQAQTVNTTVPTLNVGDAVTDDGSNATYSVTSSTPGNLTVTYSKPVSAAAQTVTVPSSITVDGQTYEVTEIAPNAFKGCKKLKSITIGANIRKIGSNAFAGCKNLKTVKIKTTSLTKKTVGKNAFKGINAKAKVKAPKKKLKDYRKILKNRGINRDTQKIVAL